MAAKILQEELTLDQSEPIVFEHTVFSFNEKPANDWITVANHIPEKQVLPENRLALINTVREAINCREISLTEQELSLAIKLAEYLADGVLIAQIHEMMFARTDAFHSQYVTRAINYAESLIKLGLFERSMSIIELALLSDPFDKRLINKANGIQKQWNQFPYEINDCRSVDLMLMPLTKRFNDEFKWQYADENISALCNLPEFTCDEDWLDWFTKNNEVPNQHVYAVMHKKWGFIGSVSIEVFQGVGFFYYWLGADFQGKGFGPQAVSTMLHLAQKYHNADCCYAKVYHHNEHSHKAMAKLGFRSLSTVAKPPFDNELFYYCGPKKSQWSNYRELQWLLAMQYSLIELEGPVGCLYTGN